MNLPADAPPAFLALFGFLLAAAAIQDAATMRIANRLSLLLALGAVAAAIAAGPVLALWQNVAGAALVLTAGTALFAAGKLGGGDVKLFAAAILWFDAEGALRMAVAVLLAGGALALVILAVRSAGWSPEMRGQVAILRPGAGIPYGVAIAIGALASAVVQGP